MDNGQWNIIEPPVISRAKFGVLIRFMMGAPPRYLVVKIFIFMDVSDIR